MSEEIIYSQIPKLATEFAGMKMCVCCGGDLEHRPFKVLLYDVFNNKKAIGNVKLLYCKSCGVPFASPDDIKRIKNLDKNVHMEAFHIDRNSHVPIIDQINENLFKEPRLYNDSQLLEEKTLIIVGKGKNHTCVNGRKANTKHLSKLPFKMINYKGEIELRQLYKCTDCGLLFMKEDVFERNVENYNKYRFIRQENMPSIPTADVEVFLKANELHVGNPLEHPCIDGKKHSIETVEVKMKRVNGKKKRTKVQKCSVCQKVFIKDIFYQDWKDKLIPYKYVLPSRMLKKQPVKQTEQVKPNSYIISPKDFLTRVNTFQCSNKNHTLIDITATVKVMSTNGALNEIEIPAAYCETCKKYYILEPDYQRLKKYGHIICKIVEHTYWVNKGKGNNPFNLNEESVLHMLGYNVNQQANLSQVQRWGILEIAVDEKIMTRMEICSHIDYLINRSKNKKNFDLAISKWRADRNHISNYVMGSRKVEVGKITIKIPKK